MSTGETISYIKTVDGDKYHLYRELAEEEGFVWLSVPDHVIRTHGIGRNHQEHLIRIPKEVWKSL